MRNATGIPGHDRSHRTDVFVIGGGINGAAVARDAAGRGLSVCLAERGDYACATSSASSKLIHGGLRYLERFEFRLVAESLREREVLLKAAPHIVAPLRFLLPITREQKRSPLVVRIGLWLYDTLSGRRLLAKSGSLTRQETSALPRLRQEGLRSVLHYPDCWVDDSRLVLENILDARSRGADVANRRAVTSVEPVDDGYRVTFYDRGVERRLVTRILVNAAGPWVNDVIKTVGGATPRGFLRLVRGSHIVVPMPWPAVRDAYTLQVDDGRVVFVIPWMEKYMIIGTTDVLHERPPDQVSCSEEERDYLLASYNAYFKPALAAADVVWSYAGARPLVDDGSENPSKLTRDYVLHSQRHADGGLITIYGGKVTTHRKLADTVLSNIADLAPGMEVRPPWTESAPLPGGRMTKRALADYGRSLDVVPTATATRWISSYGSNAEDIVAMIRANPDLAKDIAKGVPEAELIYAAEVEDALCAEDFLYRRTKLFLALSADDIGNIERWFEHHTMEPGQTHECRHDRKAG